MLTELVQLVFELRPHRLTASSGKVSGRPTYTGVPTRLLLLISREPMQKPLARGRVGDEGGAGWLGPGAEQDLVVDYLVGR